MAQRIPERYAPGELDRTKRNLGHISNEDALEMARILGGEVGTERSASEIDKKYRDLADLNRRRSDRFIKTSTNSIIFQRTDRPDSKVRIPAPPKADDAGYLQRVKMNFLAARPEHQLMRYSRALLSVLSFALPIRDLVNPGFVKKGDVVFFDHVEEFVSSVKGLASKARGNPLTRSIHPFYFRVIDEICGWEVERIHDELTHMQRSPRSITFDQCRSLCSAFYKPLVALMDIDEEFFVGGALKKLHDAILMTIPKNHPDVDVIKRLYRTSRTKMTLVFREIKYRLYPLLLKVSSDTVLEFDEFFLENRDEILDSLAITPEHVLHAPVIDDADGLIDDISPESAVSDDGQPISENEKPPAEDPLLEPEVQLGIEVLRKLFPGAGFGKLKDYPDLYRYFQPFLNFPRGVELLSPTDPLHQVVVLVAILQELLYGFKSITFGTLRDSDGVEQPVDDRIESRLIAWRAVLDETILDEYIMELYEYCRQYEKENQYGSTRIGRRLAQELEWKKKLLLLPHLPVQRPYGFSDETLAHLPRLQREIDHLDMYLSVIAHNIAIKNDTTCVLNPRAITVFEVPNPVSKRLAKVLQKEGRQLTNDQLILHAAAILSLLNALVSDPDSHLYHGDSPLFRTEDGTDGKPMFTVPPLNPSEIIQRHDSEKDVDEFRADSMGKDPESGFFIARLLKRYLKSTTALCETRTESCCIVAIGIQGFAHISRSGDKDAASEKRLIHEIKQNIRLFSDLPFKITDGNFVLLMPDTTAEEAVAPIKRILIAVSGQSGEDEKVPTCSAVVEYKSGVSIDHHLRLLRSAIRDVFKLPAPGIVVLDHDTGSAEPVPVM